MTMKKQIMTKTAFATILLIFGIGLASCNKDPQLSPELDSLDKILGNYSGSLSIDGLKSGIDANAEVTLNSDLSVWVHCYGGDIDTTFMLDLFNHGDSIMVCLTGTNFMNEFGHARNHQGGMMTNWGSTGNNSMGGGMMGHNGSTGNTSGWTNHLNEEHQNSNENHFGGFDISNNTFGYSFRNPENIGSFIKFEGTKDSN